MVLLEGISVVVRVAALARYPGAWEGFRDDCPNETLAADGDLARVGFMSPGDVEAFVTHLGAHGLVYLLDGAAQDLVVVDQMRGPMAPCAWIEAGHVTWTESPRRQVAACRLRGGAADGFVHPIGWTYEGSLSERARVVPAEAAEDTVEFVRRDGAVDVYRDRATGEPLYRGRTSA